MIRQLNAVLLTYITRRSLWLAGGFMLLFFILPFSLSIASRRAGEGLDQSALFLLAFPAGGAGYLLVSQGKWQFVDPRSRLLPGFAAPHLAWLGLIGAAGMFALPLLVALVTGCSALGAVAAAVAIGVSYLWAMHRMDMLMSLVGMAAFFSLMPAAGRAFWLHPATAPRYAAVHAGIIAAGAVGLAAWLARLAMLREEMSDYNIPTNAQAGSATRMERSQATKMAALQVVRNPLNRWLTDWWHDQLADLHATTTSGRQRLLRYGFAALPIKWQAFWMAYVICLIMLVLAATSPVVQNASSFMMPLTMFVMWPALFPGQLLAMRRARLGQESLLPLGRREFVDGLVRTLARDTATLWLIMHVAMLGLYLTVRGEPAPAGITAAVVATSIAVQPMLFGLYLRVARYESGLVRILAMMGAALLAMPAAAAIVLLALVHLAASLAMAAAVVALGLWITRSARDAWLNTELG